MGCERRVQIRSQILRPRPLSCDTVGAGSVEHEVLRQGCLSSRLRLEMSALNEDIRTVTKDMRSVALPSSLASGNDGDARCVE